VLPAETPLRVDAATGDRYRVRLPDGGAGFVPARRADGGERRLALGRDEAPRPMLERPAAGAVVVDSVAAGRAGDGVTVLGRWGGFLLVRTAAGRLGWLPTASAPIAASGAGRAERGGGG
jgi:hypothetical protein